PPDVADAAAQWTGAVHALRLLHVPNQLVFSAEPSRLKHNNDRRGCAVVEQSLICAAPRLCICASDWQTKTLCGINSLNTLSWRSRISEWEQLSEEALHG